VYVSGQDATALRRRLVWTAPGGKRTTVSEKLRNYYWPAISADGKRLAVTVLEHDNWGLWVQDLERDTQTPLTSDAAADFFPVWSSDGRWIAFCSQRDGRGQIYRQLADGSGQAERLLDGQYEQGPGSFSPDGKYLLFVEDHPDSKLDIWILALDGERKAQVFASSRFNEFACLFPPMGSGSPTSQMNREEMRSMSALSRVTAADDRSPRRAVRGLAGQGTDGGCSIAQRTQ
jgi:Tol biopolymer transport system component